MRKMNMVADHMWGRAIVMTFALICAWQDIRYMSVSIGALATGAAAVAAASAIMFVTGLQKDPSAALTAEETVGTAASILIGCLPGTVMVIFSFITGQIGAGDGLYFIVVGAALGIKRVMIMIVLASFVQVLICAGFLLMMTAKSNRKSGYQAAGDKKNARGLFSRRLPYLPAAGIALLWLFVLG